MTVNWNKMSVPLQGGVDTKSDGKTIPAEKAAVLENAIFEKRGSIRKRNGYDAIPDDVIDVAAPLSDGRSIATRDDELVQFSARSVYGYVPAVDKWARKGALESVIADEMVVANVNSNQTNADMATASGMRLVAWEDSRGGVRIAVVDTETNTEVIHDQLLDINGSCPRVISVSGLFHVYYYRASASELRLKIVNPQDLSGSVAAAPVVLASDASGLLEDAFATPYYGTAAPSALCFDAVEYGDKVLMAYGTTAIGTIGNTDDKSYKLSWISPSGAVVSQAEKKVRLVTSLAVGVDPRGYPMVAWFTPYMYGVSYGGVNVDEFDDALSFIRTLNITNGTPAGAFFCPRLSFAIPDDAEDDGFYHAKIFIEFPIYSYEVYTGETPPGTSTDPRDVAEDRNRYVTLADYAITSGVGALYSYFHAALASRAFLHDGKVYAHFVYESTLQSTFFCVRHDGLMVARLFPGVAGGIPRTPVLPRVETDPSDANVHRWAAVYKTRLTTDVDLPVYADKNIKIVSYDWGTANGCKSVQVGRSLYVNGSIPWMYDGVNVVEAGFTLFPEMDLDSQTIDGGTYSRDIAQVADATSPFLDNEVYSYRVYYEWTNAAGERERSTTAYPVSFRMTGNGYLMDLRIPTLTYTKKAINTDTGESRRSAVSIVVYRTEKNPTDAAAFYRVSSADPQTDGEINGWIYNDNSTGRVFFQDRMSDADLITQELDPNNSGELDNVMPEAFSIMAAGQNRIFVAGSVSPSRVRYSKLTYLGNTVAFNDALTLDVPEEGGPITGMAVLNSTLIIFKRDRIYGVSGDGPNNLGVGSYSLVQLITADTGCLAQNTIVVTPEGLMFQSPKGIYLLTQALQAVYAGADVEAYNDQVFSSAVLIPDKNQVRFLTADGSALLLDYLFKQWSTFTDHEGLAATIWGGKYTYLRNSGRVYQEGTTYSDNGREYPMVLETPWYKVDGLQGFMRVKSLHGIGEWMSSHDLRIYAYYDYDMGTRYDVDWEPENTVNTTNYGSETPLGNGTPYGGANTSRVLQFRAVLPVQKCQAVKFRFEDVVTTAGESYRLNELALLIGLKKGAFRLPSAHTV